MGFRWSAWWSLKLDPSQKTKPKPSLSPARAVDQGAAPSFREPEPYQAEPKVGHLGAARPCKSLNSLAGPTDGIMVHMVGSTDQQIDTMVKGIRPTRMSLHGRACRR